MFRLISGLCVLIITSLPAFSHAYSPATTNAVFEFETEEYDSSPEIILTQGHHYVKPYTRKDGTRVRGHYRTNPDGNIHNNWSTKGNVNPFTGKKGTKDPYKSRFDYPSKIHRSYDNQIDDPC